MPAKPTKEQLAARAARQRLQYALNRKIATNFEEYLEIINSGIVNRMDTVSVLRNARASLIDGLTATIEGSAQQSVDLARALKEAEYAPILTAAKKLLSRSGATTAEIKALTDLPKVSAMFGGGLDAEIIDKVWSKAWKDAMTVDDRIKRLSAKATEYTERIVKQGISEGTSAKDMMYMLGQHFVDEGVEIKAAFRLAAHTTNMTYESANAAISMDVNFVMGIRIVRGMYGPASATCDICFEHGGDDFKEYMKENGDDLAILADQPPYHANCNCGTEDIMETAEEFVARARAGN